jgi:hypothetical protein
MSKLVLRLRSFCAGLNETRRDLSVIPVWALHANCNRPRRDREELGLADMTRRATAILLMFILSSGIALFWGLVQASSARDVIFDYRVMDLGARCLLRHGDLYSQTDMMRVYDSEDRDHLRVQPPSSSGRYLAAVQVYPPTAELVFAPFALLLWRIAYPFWIALTLTLLTLAVFLIWQTAQQYDSDLPFYLGCIVLANSGILFSGGNPAGLVVSLCIISMWCVFQGRFAAVAVVCMALSLAVKPHDGGVIWLYLLLLGGRFRTRALQCLALCFTLGVAASIWVWQVSPHWITELRSNIATISTAGSYNDPAGSVTALMVNLQPAIALFRNDPHFYNALSYLICAPILICWLVLTLRQQHAEEGLWLGLAVCAVLSLLPVYHRPYDAKILVLTFPACAALWAKRGPIAWTAVCLTTASVLLTSDLPVAALSNPKLLHLAVAGLGQRFGLLLITRPASLVLLATSLFYLWAYSKSSGTKRPTPARSHETSNTQSALWAG